MVDMANMLKYFMSGYIKTGSVHDIDLGQPDLNFEITSFNKLEKFAPGLMGDKMLINTADGKLYIVGMRE